jgi:FixJ family two-component response regulator
MRRTSESDEATVVAVVDDNACIRETIQTLLTSVGYAAETFRSAEEFLAWRRKSQPGCLILDVRLPEISGLQLQRDLSASGDRIPIVFITGHGDVAMAVQAIKAGAVDFLLKPFREQDLLEAVQGGLRRDREWREEQRKLSVHLHCYQSLTEREREIMRHVVTGQINKQIAAATGVSDGTVKIHRAQVMKKMRVASLADLVRVADLISESGVSGEPRQI